MEKYYEDLDKYGDAKDEIEFEVNYQWVGLICQNEVL